ncbi:hypothetical protein HX99_02875 [Peptococcaceae bacterium SCADC1_2_3]|jgi:hypothetical protein|nr:hypothetical protein DK28_0204965 [Peptococcaceae bacterium SCADC1_2_3]HBQ29189.1 hypothetical protein [Desulfotomaculum sp.]KFI35410.1 hypothetical protein HY00_05175 [Peptococcaceae bacterium SCADC1_2_3]KFI36625.1 hypothetical protein HX99_02875 [Peptococcaceae bacterium SCADC1_2_3]KFI37837.1 hypothetical protein HY02_02365 [Peptococcaceae bacterium SCADC1_2_3]
MVVRFHPHAREKMAERGATEDEVSASVKQGERFPARFGRSGFRRNFPFDREWRGKHYKSKQVETYAVREGDEWLVITVITRYF